MRLASNRAQIGVFSKFVELLAAPAKSRGGRGAEPLLPERIAFIVPSFANLAKVSDYQP